VKKEEPMEKPAKVAEEKSKEEAKEPEAKPAEPTPAEKKREAVAEEKPAPAEERPAVVEEEPVPAEKKTTYFPEVRSSGFMSDVEYRGIGIVLESKDGKNLMSAGDIIYITFRTSEPILIGDKYTVFRAAEEIKHPVTGKSMGRKYNIIGNIQLIDQHANFFTAKVVETFDAIMKGDYVQPYSKEKMEGFAGK
jgi:hypothetical protein